MDLRSCHSVIVYGGTFDPPHLAHVVLPKLAMEAVGADAVAYVPAAISPLKQDRPLPTAAEHRLTMLRLALADQPHAVILTDELDRGADGKPSYTVDTLESLRERLGPGVTLRLLMGADQVRLFPQWRSPQRIVELAKPLVMVRPPDGRESLLESLPPGYDPLVWSARVAELPLMDVSATEIRRRVGAGQSIAGMVPPAVERYIAQHGLYR